MPRSFTWLVETDHPVAVDSFDHIHPFGTASDNSQNPVFNERLWSLLSCGSPCVLDIGCAGGGMVKQMWADGWDAIGIEGSDYSKARGRAEWAELSEVCLFTADATKPFYIYRQSEDGIFPGRFHAITAWEVLEHIEEPALEQFFKNVNRLLKPEGMFICSIASYPSPHEGVDLHRTQKEPAWWEERLKEFGLIRDLDAEAHFGGNWVRDGTANFVLRPKLG